MHDRHVMIDLETLSTENDAAIIAIGAVEFDLDRIIQERRWLIDPKLASGRRDESTLTWWRDQQFALQRRIWGGTDGEDMVLGHLADWMLQFHDDHWIWAGPSTFDLAILKTRYQDRSWSYPINWRNQRDLTTISRIAQELSIDYSGEMFEAFVAHDPLDDCIKQARRTQIILKALIGMKNRSDGWAGMEQPNG